MDELKTCPICGSSVSIKELHIGPVRVDGRQDFYAKINCDCGLTFEQHWTTHTDLDSCIAQPDDIATAWNRRAE